LTCGYFLIADMCEPGGGCGPLVVSSLDNWLPTYLPASAKPPDANSSFMNLLLSLMLMESY